MWITNPSWSCFRRWSSIRISWNILPLVNLEMTKILTVIGILPQPADETASRSEQVSMQHTDCICGRTLLSPKYVMMTRHEMNNRFTSLCNVFLMHLLITWPKLPLPMTLRISYRYAIWSCGTKAKKIMIAVQQMESYFSGIVWLYSKWHKNVLRFF